MPENRTIGGKKVTVYPCAAENRPVIYLNTFADEGERVRQILTEKDCASFTLVTIGGLNWDHDMSPWAIPPISPKDTPCTGGADAYLELLINEIVPSVDKELKSVSWRGIAGYSLAGLFALWSLYETDLFARAGSMSGSLWFPDFKEFVYAREPRSFPKKIYFSLGDKEHKTRNPFLKTVRDNTEEIEAFYRARGVETVFRLNEGNHYQNAAERTAAGIEWLLRD
ncbi:MAG: alpha/beta hydrolase-fold protein [Bacteroides sp.]|nr:alpha/beta hydrolase-fold protein [Eubacterium sp.]MCM1417611.1 alpha/beta hydrolase-fold protein [Roseburia sp.]MCM1461678.1 alpha/beta hydrolase-fold protein [Bacteroides sp.]